MLKAWSWTSSRGAASAMRRPGDVLDVDQGTPGRAVALEQDLPEVNAQAVRLFSTMSNRIRGETP